MNIVFWQNMPTHIQSSAISEFAKLWDGQVTCVWADGISEDRRRLGWEIPKIAGVHELYLDSADWTQQIRSTIVDNPDAVHIFSGLNAYKKITFAYNNALSAKCTRLALMVEPGISLGLKGALRPYRAWWLARRYKRHIKMVLAMGNRGVDFYRRVGFSPELVFPYMYQAPLQPLESRSAAHASFSNECPPPLQLVYVGKFDCRKGIDVLLKSLTCVQNKNVCLRIIGNGPEQERLESFCKKVGICSLVEWRGAMRHEEVLQQIAKSDVCIVPSRFEGWGVVVNESIGAGVPVICTEKTTSKDLVIYGDCGKVVKTGSKRHLAQAIDAINCDRGLLRSFRDNAIAFRQFIEPTSVASYLNRVLVYQFLYTDSRHRGGRPSAPWQNG